MSEFQTETKSATESATKSKPASCRWMTYAVL